MPTECVTDAITTTTTKDVSEDATAITDVPETDPVPTEIETVDKEAIMYLESQWKILGFDNPITAGGLICRAGTEHASDDTVSDEPKWIVKEVVEEGVLTSHSLLC